MPRQLFRSIDPTLLDRYSDRRREGFGRRMPLELRRSLDLFRRSLQSLPARELRMLFQSFVLKVDQDDIASLFLVRQSNISYRLQRTEERLKLRREIQSIASETTLRNALLDAGTPLPFVDICLGILKTFSQTVTANGLGVSQGSVRHAFDTTRKRIEEYRPPTPQQEQERQALLQMMTLATANWNRLQEIEAQNRYAWKRGKNLPTPPQPSPKKRWGGAASPPGSSRRRGPWGYAWVQRRTGQDVYSASINHAGRRLNVCTAKDIHLAAYAVNAAWRLANGPHSPDINNIAAEHMPDQQDRAAIEGKVRSYLARKGVIAPAG